MYAGLLLATAALLIDSPPDEIACAKSLGIDPLEYIGPDAPSYLKYLTWRADLVVEGRTVEVCEDLDGPYHTQVRVEPSSVLKGRLPYEPLTIALLSGPVRSRRGRFASQWVSHEARFEADETVLLFLRYAVEYPPLPPESYQPPDNFYTPVHGETIVTSDGAVLVRGWPDAVFDLEQARADIRSVADAQIRNCR